MEDRGFIVDIFNLRSKNSNIPTILTYDGVLLGSGIRIGRWTKEAKKFLKKSVMTINGQKLTIGIYLSSGEASDPEKKSGAVNKLLIEVFNEVGLDIGDHVLYDAFGGVYDLSKTTNLNWINKKMLSAAAQEDPEMIVPNERREYRDWNQITEFLQNYISKF